MAFSGVVRPLHREIPAVAAAPSSSSRVQWLPLDGGNMPHPSALASRIGSRRKGTLSVAHTAAATTFLVAAVLLGRRHRRAMQRMRAADAGQAEVRDFLLQGPKKGNVQDVRQLLLSGWTPEVRLTGQWREDGPSRAMDECKPAPGLPCELQALQGHWEDLAMGFVVDIDGDEADFNDGTGIWKAEVGSSGLTLRGALLLGGLPDLASWRRPDGREMIWQRLDPEIVNGAQLHKQFLNYKWARTMLKRRISTAMAQQDFEVAGALLILWKRGWGIKNETTTLEQELRLRAGCFLVPGACVVHRRFGYRAAVLGCEPWVRAPLVRRLSAQDTRWCRLQPLYCVLVDDRDVAGGGALWVPETDLEPSKDVFPIQSCYKDRLLEEHETIQAYLPGTALKQAARRQHLGMPFTLQGV